MIRIQHFFLDLQRVPQQNFGLTHPVLDAKQARVRVHRVRCARVAATVEACLLLEQVFEKRGGAVEIAGDPPECREIALRNERALMIGADCLAQRFERQFAELTCTLVVATTVVQHRQIIGRHGDTRSCR